MVTDETIAGNDGAIDITVSGGTPSYDYNWSTGASTEDINGLTQGSYGITISDANGCIADSSGIIVKNTASPKPLAFGPDSGATGIATDAEIWLVFETGTSLIDPSGIIIQDKNTGIPVTNVSGNMNGDSLLITHDNFENGTEYVVFIPSGTLQSINGVDNDDIAWSFTTIFDAPVVISTTPDTNATGAEVDQVISVVFDQNISVINESGITMSNSAVVTNVSAVDSLLTISHDPLINNTTYTVNIAAGSVQNTDSVVNEDYSWSFTTSASAIPETFGEISVDIYPNPATDGYINVEVQNINGKINVEILNLLSKEVISKTINNDLTSIDVSALPDGVYVVLIKVDDTIVKYKNISVIK